MGRQTTILQILVASPDELKGERVALESVIRELNHKTPIQTVHDSLESLLANTITGREAMLSMMDVVSGSASNI